MSYTVKRLGEICRFEYGKNLTEKDRVAGNINVYGSNGIVGTHTTAFTSGKTIIIGRKGSIGKVLISEQPCWAIDTTYYIDETCTECDLDWLSFILRSLNLEKLNKASGVPGLNRDDAYEKNIAVPNLKSHQQLIALNLKSQFNEIEKARESTEFINQDLKRLKHLVLNDFLSEFHEAEKFKLGEKAITTSGSTPSRGRKDYWQPAEIPWIKTGEIAFAPITKSEEYVSVKALKECSLKLLPENTVLIAMYGQGKTRGQSAILKVPATINQACFAIQPNETWDPEFLQLWLMYSYQDMRNMSENRGGNQANLNGGLLNSFEVPAPSLQVQQEAVSKINSALTELDVMKASWRETAEEINGLPNRLLAQAFKEIENG
ncbi:restriction endonuclease S subunit [Desulfosporosinus acidiphilus SJ4]|uniref:Restriction endonuclease S subunit n=1 Tax=Desulfosporosinus acidiphilus (strain DSM 22704 / JCM 16185 / SJ4) TaxID=646529 RepID=I4D393_DESAJ|nr:restriction endonuclease S subunit [Desulfosporosinus acidiphilus SJ4]